MALALRYLYDLHSIKKPNLYKIYYSAYSLGPLRQLLVCVIPYYILFIVS